MNCILFQEPPFADLEEEEDIKLLYFLRLGLKNILMAYIVKLIIKPYLRSTEAQTPQRLHGELIERVLL